MNLKKILLAGTFFLSTSLASSQDKLKFDVYNDWLLGIRLNMSSVTVNPRQIAFSFLFGSYSMEFKQPNDSTYQETVKDNWAGRDEFFDYSKNLGYTLFNYSVTRGEPREEKEALVKRVFDKKYKSLLELFDDLENGRINDGDSIHFSLLGMPYSIKAGKKQNSETIVYSGTFKVKKEPGDSYVLKEEEPVKLYTIKEDGKEIPIGFTATLSHAKKKKEISIEGILKKDKD